MRIKKLSFMAFLVLLVGCNQTTTTLLSPQKGEEPQTANWQYEPWVAPSHYNATASSQFDDEVLTIASDTLIAERWFKKIPVKPFANYRVTGSIKTENVKGEHGAGAGFGLGKFTKENDTIFTGTTDWTTVAMEFETQMDDSFMLELFLGKNGKASGTVHFDNLRLEELSATTLKPSIQIDLTQKEAPMSPYIYGQFIEHMGKCIYGGIWAEMLQDRKFYHPIGAKKSPWKINVDTTTVKIDSTHSYSKGNFPVFQKVTNLEVSQTDLALEANKSYVGHVNIKSSGITSLEISLGDTTQTIQLKKSNTFQKVPFEFNTNTTTDSGIFNIKFNGTGTISLVAISLMPSDNVQGFRKDVLALLKELDAPIYRWPGGNFVSGYNWKDGIGDPDLRPTKFERAWNGLEYNDVGIHEFMQLVDLLDTEANIAVNTGLGTAEMAAEEVAYFNGDASTKMGQWRAKNGHEAPYNIKLWAVGNEMFGDWQLGHMPIEDYVKKHNEVAEAMWAVDPTIDLIGVGFPGRWNDMMYENCADNMTFISEHFYKQDWHAGGLLTHVNQMPATIKDIAEEHRRARKEHPEVAKKNIKIAMDEWNYWYGPHEFGLLGTRYFLRDALGIAAGLNEFSRQSDIYYMANYAQTVNVIGAIKTTKTKSWLEGTGLVLKLYRNEFGTQPVTFSGNAAPLDVAVTLTEDGKYLTISVVNATHDEIPLQLQELSENIATAGTAFIVQGANDMVYNDVAHQDNIYINETAVNIKNNSLQIPKESAGIYKFKINQ
ncbi:alpha-N-arabinofuranosidase [Pustulibacterium marinum]|uniref:non-reducing end alpha-L-arabinofuranosidase n=1 Tax=Pustulibacterium marinum TaxID=1224947 RepID=A0A1I7GWL7_9FLAO|nr:alpha-L-arabinofuranosidase C-terminal domain-containing protein [Pustulibacterium marinum]SFU52819.1 alpha-N-arabinofuranosidase [Pustulibacterium marinum]